MQLSLLGHLDVIVVDVNVVDMKMLLPTVLIVLLIITFSKASKVGFEPSKHKINIRLCTIQNFHF